MNNLPFEILNEPRNLDDLQGSKPIKLEQSTRVLQQGGNNTVNINYQVNCVTNSLPVNSIHFKTDDRIDIEALLIFINTFPEPRYRYFMEYLRKKAIEKFGSKTQAARWLGMSYRRVSPGYKTKLIRNSED